ncbi:unnamed protein product [Ranitomeya imitator]|uniref:Endonuclease/exonuclease/phosphatase domain-containing protein n=1 Tax=Ranitomeya imitator TaxID=111125 RepID=A0ABN9KTB0_9NEOB|nr:unnamed protein product [Ranitomeya imitator]
MVQTTRIWIPGPRCELLVRWTPRQRWTTPQQTWETHIRQKTRYTHQEGVKLEEEGTGRKTLDLNKEDPGKHTQMGGKNISKAIHSEEIGTKQNPLNCMLANARSLTNKMEELEAEISTGNFDIVGITETWLDESYDWAVNLQGYSLFRKDRKNRRGGGVCLYVKSCLKSTLREDISEGNEDVESIWVEIHGGKNGNKILIGVCYKPPNITETMESLLLKQIDEAATHNEVLVMEDFNYPDINWETETCETHKGNRFLLITKKNYLSQLVQNPTRGAALLDLILSNRPDRITNLQVVGHLGNSDHNIVQFHLSFTRGTCQGVTKTLNFRKAKFDQLRDALNLVDWDNILRNKNTDKWEMFKNILNRQCKRFIPCGNKRTRNRKNPMWLNKEVRQAINSKKKAFALLKQDGTIEALKNYREKNTLSKKLIKAAKKETEKHIAKESKTNPKLFFNYINSKRIKTENVSPLKNSEERMVVDDEEKANILNTFFSTVFTVENEMLGEIPRNNENPILRVTNLTQEEVRDRLNKIKIDKSPGPDGIHPRVLRELTAVSCTAIMSSHIISALLLHKYRAGVFLTRLLSELPAITEDILLHGFDVGFSGQRWDILRHSLSILRRSVSLYSTPSDDVYVLCRESPDGIRELSLQSSSLLPVFLLEAIGACAIHALLTQLPSLCLLEILFSQDEMIEMMICLCSLLPKNILLQPPCQNVNLLCQDILDKLVHCGLLSMYEDPSVPSACDTGRRRFVDKLTWKDDDLSDSDSDCIGETMKRHYKLGRSSHHADYFVFLCHLLNPVLKTYESVALFLQEHGGMCEHGKYMNMAKFVFFVHLSSAKKKKKGRTSEQY